jgi:hypothetical protein
MELRGKRAIQKATGRTWDTLVKLQKNHGFPMAQIGTSWISDSEEIDRWRLQQLRRRE